MKGYWNWKLGGALLGVTFFLALFLIKPIGVSTQFSVTAGIMENTVNKELIYEDETHKTGYGSTNAYYDKSEGKLAKSIEKPIQYSYVFVGAMILGGLLSVLTMKRTKEEKEQDKACKIMPQVVRETVSTKASVRYLLVFLGGAISLFGARLAGGCTSGHMMSGISQASLSGMVFAAAVFIVAIPMALLVYRKRR